MHKRCWTAERRFRHGLQDSANCIFCDQLLETMDHVILGCVYSREVWAILLTKLHLLHAIQVQEEDVIGWWLRNRKLLDKQLRKAFDSFVFLVGWRLWKEQNSRTFQGVAVGAGALAELIWEEAGEWCSAGYRRLQPLLMLL